ncbi:MAG: TonB-dependent receptor plug domain-containing protein, partial [Saprospiraceae bacterium]
MKAIQIAFFLYLGTLSVLHSQQVLRGVISDQSGVKIIGANIQLKGSLTGTSSDQQGAFELQIPSGNETIVVSYTGYQTREIEIGSSSFLEIVLEEGVLLETALVTALGIQRSERSLGYAVEKISGDELNRIPAANLVNLLSGRAAGVTVLGSSGGNLGGSARITIRGLRSIIGENQPLFVVDGVPMDNSNFTNFAQVLANGNGNVYESQRDYGNAIQDLNPIDIENINVLKGQAAAALYGSRGANGVIIVTTKKGEQARKGIGIRFSSTITFDKVSIFPKFQNKYGGGVDLLPRGYTDQTGFYKIPYIEFGPDGDTVGIFQSFDLVPIYGVDESSGIRFNTSTDEHLKHLDGFQIGDQHVDQYLFTNGYGTNQANLYFRDWNSWDAWDVNHFGKSRLWEAGDDPIKFFETGISSNYNISFEGATDKSTFRLSYTRFDQKGIYPNSKLERNTISLNASYKFSEKLQLLTGVNYVNNKNKGRSSVTYDFRGGFNPAQNFSEWWHTQLRFDDLKQYENPDGSMRTWNRQSADNPRPQYWDNPFWSRYKNFETDGRDRIFGNIGLTYQLNKWFQISGRTVTDFYFEQREERIAFGSLLEQQYVLDQYHVRESNADIQLRFEANINPHLNLQALVGTSKLWKKLERNFGATIGGMNIPDVYRLQNSKLQPLIQNTLSEKQIESIFSSVSLAWKHSVYLDLTGRKDWSSTLPLNANAYFYPSASLSYVFTEHLKIPSFDFGKLRLGWAKVGADGDPYTIYKTYSGNPNFGNYANYTVNNTLNKINLKPEQTKSIEAGLDIRLLKNRLGIDLTYYTGKTTDQIIPLATSAASGYTRQFINAGEISNKGIELVVNLVPLKKSKLSWNIDLNFGKNTNKILSIVPEDPSIKSLPLGSPGAITFNALIGEPYGTILGYNYLYDKNGKKLIDPTTGYYLKSSAVMPI